MSENFRWDKDGKYKRIAHALVGQCAGAELTVEESLFVLGLATGEINQQGNYVRVKREPILPSYYTDNHTT